jgi:ribosome-associated heat shock protein Hsp15
MESVRVDRWLWAVRVYPSRTSATDACRGGRVAVNGRTAKPATAVRSGDVVSAVVGRRRRRLEVRQVIERRVSPALAAECMVDCDPVGDHTESVATSAAGGRPTKRDRRRLERMRGRSHA